ncbi:MAG TPA: phosphoribosyltransferase family protein [Desulfosarcina sp.]|nr:phosphoribosyltransferase family protein [Desulfosarcina sp.]
MTTVYEKEALRNRTHVFADRRQAGDALGAMLAPRYRDASDAILLAIPMGGVPVALAIQAQLNCPMDLAIVRKIQIPGNTEAGFGAITGEGDIILNEPLMAQLELTEKQVAQQWAKVRDELTQRNRRLRGERPMPELAGKTVILADDGLASGYTMKAALFMVKKRKAANTVVAVPTAPQRTIDALADGPDAIYCANIRETYAFAVAESYENWHDLTEEEVVAMLEG